MTIKSVCLVAVLAIGAAAPAMAQNVYAPRSDTYTTSGGFTFGTSNGQEVDLYTTSGGFTFGKIGDHDVSCYTYSSGETTCD